LDTERTACHLHFLDGITVAHPLPDCENPECRHACLAARKAAGAMPIVKKIALEQRRCG